MRTILVISALFAAFVWLIIPLAKKDRPIIDLVQIESSDR